MEIHRARIPKEDQVKINDRTPPGFPRKFFAATVCGSSRSGKTTLIVNWIQALAPTYAAVCVFTPSIDDPIFKSLKGLDNVYISNLISNHALHNLLQRMKDIYQQDKTRDHCLVVIDDFGLLARQSGDDVRKPPKAPEENSSGIRQMLDTLYSRARHSGCSTLCSFHDTLQMTPLQRCNSTHWVLYRLSERQYKKIAPEIRCHLSEREFVELADKVTIKPYHGLLVDLKAPRNEDVFRVVRPAAGL